MSPAAISGWDGAMRPLAITVADPARVGAEITAKAPAT
jgi:hypothetical protein